MDKNWIFIKDEEFGLIIKAIKFALDKKIFDNVEENRADELKSDLEEYTDGSL